MLNYFEVVKDTILKDEFKKSVDRARNKSIEKELEKQGKVKVQVSHRTLKDSSMLPSLK